MTTTAGRPMTIDNDKIDSESVKDAAGRFMAGGFGCGISWYADAPDAELDNKDEHGIKTRDPDVLRAARRTVTEEKAGHHEPEWVAGESDAVQSQVRAWLATHTLSRHRGDSVREFRTWDHHHTFGAAPANPANYDVAHALSYAKLDGPLEPLLRLVALQDGTQWPRVLRYLTAKGYRPSPCRTAIRKILFPYARIVNVDAEADRHTATYREEVRAARATLERWLRTASWRFMRAHGWQRRTHEAKPAALSRMPKRARPRFEGGVDWQAMPPGHPNFRKSDARLNKGRKGTGEPCAVLVLSGAAASAHRRAHPAQGRIKAGITDAQLWGAWADHAREAGNEARSNRRDSMDWLPLHKLVA